MKMKSVSRKLLSCIFIAAIMLTCSVYFFGGQATAENTVTWSNDDYFYCADLTSDEPYGQKLIASTDGKTAWVVPYSAKELSDIKKPTDLFSFKYGTENSVDKYVLGLDSAAASFSSNGVSTQMLDNVIRNGLWTITTEDGYYYSISAQVNRSRKYLSVNVSNELTLSNNSASCKWIVVKNPDDNTSFAFKTKLNSVYLDLSSTKGTSKSAVYYRYFDIDFSNTEIYMYCGVDGTKKVEVREKGSMSSIKTPTARISKGSEKLIYWAADKEDRSVSDLVYYYKYNVYKPKDPNEVINYVGFNPATYLNPGDPLGTLPSYYSLVYAEEQDKNPRMCRMLYEVFKHKVTYTVSGITSNNKYNVTAIEPTGSFGNSFTMKSGDSAMEKSLIKFSFPYVRDDGYSYTIKKLTVKNSSGTVLDTFTPGTNYYGLYLNYGCDIKVELSVETKEQDVTTETSHRAYIGINQFHAVKTLERNMGSQIFLRASDCALYEDGTKMPVIVPITPDLNEDIASYNYTYVWKIRLTPDSEPIILMNGAEGYCTLPDVTADTTAQIWCEITKTRANGSKSITYNSYENPTVTIKYLPFSMNLDDADTVHNRRQDTILIYTNSAILNDMSQVDRVYYTREGVIGTYDITTTTTNYLPDEASFFIFSHKFYTGYGYTFTVTDNGTYTFYIKLDDGRELCKTVTWNNLCDTPEISGCHITAQPNKTTYCIGEEFSAEGLQADIYYYGGITETVGADKLTVSGFNSSVIGDKTVTASFDTVSDSFNVSIVGHTWNEGEITTPATCCAKGTITFSCTACKTTKTEEIEINGANHSGRTETRNKKSATCIETGYSGDEYCLGCGVKTAIGSEIEKIAHKWNDGEITTPATCCAKGTITFSCTACKATKTEEIEINGANHSGGTQTRNKKPATCIETGYSGDEYCLGCGVKTATGSEIKKIAHTETVIPAVGATCTKSGTTQGTKCSFCGTILKATAEVKATGHKWDSGKVTTPATEKAEGVKTFTCTVCKATKTKSIEKLVPSYNPGDINGDGKVTVADARLALRAALGKSVKGYNFKNADLREFLAADANANGKITVADARKILRASIGLENPKTWKKS